MAFLSLKPIMEDCDDQFVITCKYRQRSINFFNSLHLWDSVCCQRSVSALTHLPLMLHICVSEMGKHWFRWWFGAWSAPSHYLHRSWLIVNCTLRNKLEWNSIEILTFSFKKMCLKMSSAKWRPFCPGGDELNDVMASLLMTPSHHLIQS